MKAVYYQGKGKFEVGPCEKVEPGPGEVMLKVAYCGVCGTDVHISHGVMDHRVKTPQVIGHEMSGTIEKLGEGVTGFSVGQPVAVRPIDSRLEEPSDKGVSHICRKMKFIGIETPGAFQAYWTVPAFTIHNLPDGIDLKLAAFVEPLAVAAHDIRIGELKAGESAVVIGGGPIGMLVAMAAREKGADVTIAEVSPFRLELARKMGFRTVDSSKENLLERVMELTSGAGCDVVFEVSGSKAGARAMTEIACIRGRVVVVAIFDRNEPTPTSLFEVMWKELKVLGARVYEPEDYDAAIALVRSGKLPLADLVTEVAPLDKLPEVFATLEQKPNTMKVLIDCQA